MVSTSISLPAEGAVVEVRRSVGGKMAGPEFDAAKQRIASVDALLGSCLDLLASAPSSLSLLKKRASKERRAEAIAQLQKERAALAAALTGMFDFASNRGAEAEMAMSRLLKSDQVGPGGDVRARGQRGRGKSAHSTDSNRGAEAEMAMSRLLKSDQAVREAQAAKDTAEAALRRVNEASGRELSVRDEQLAVLQKQVQELEAEKHELQGSIAKLVRSKDNTSLKLKDLTFEYQSTADVAEREIRRLQAELKKAEEAREAGLMAANKESAEALSDKVKEQRTLQRRLDSMKNLADANKRQAEEARKQAEEAAERGRKQAEEAAAAAKRAAEAKAAREALTAELEALRREHGMLHSAFLAAGGVDKQLSAIRAAAAATAATTPRGGSKAPAGTRGGLRSRGGHCLHAGACGASANDINKLVTVPYEGSIEGLEAVVRQQKVFLCTDCMASDNSFLGA
ncbi:hypothetical protein HXX76_015355 [Chlamydomonas incerta]|uniref:Uncharacterized protein n=1 Tax=Chlamydomonas incerta TaxID=51695 RepID=A0A835VS09_CHLIN|nr:hypothetical protein HXX76_015355 [Chlamydomonas incerta]|eukprot:KAG2423389.1 hypothetical protein HXX76_015355 [Chlamydomonas incerta]